MSTLPFVLVTVAVPDDLAISIRTSVPIRAPASMFGGRFFRADLVAVPVSRPDGSAFVRFGSAGLSEAICIDPATRAVVSVWDETSAVVQATRPAWREGFVNTSLDAFVNVARAVSDRFPYYTRAAFDSEEGRHVQLELLALVEAIDPLAALPDRFWSTFTDDVGIGDFSTEDVLGAASHDIRAR